MPNGGPKANCFISTLKKASRYCWGSPASVTRSKHVLESITVGSDLKTARDWKQVFECILTGCRWMRVDAGGSLV